jgi:hypothetical protein
MEHLRAKPAEPTLQGGPAPLDEASDRVVVIGLAAEQIGNGNQDGRRQKRQLGAGAKQFGGLPDKHAYQCRRQSRHPLGPAARSRREAGQPDNDRGPYHGRPRAHEQHIAAGDHQGSQERPAAADRQQPQEPTDGVGENPDVEAGDRKDVDRAGDGKELGVVAIKRRPLAEQERGRQAGPSCRQA